MWYHNLQNRQTGFGIIEMMVAVSIFAIVMTVSVGALVILLKGNATTRGVISLSNNLSFVLDSMTRDVRTGHHYYCSNGSPNFLFNKDKTSTKNCALGADSLVYIDGFNKNRVGYRLNNSGEIEKRVSNLSTSDDTDWVALTSADDIEITDLQFFVTGTGVGTVDHTQPTVRVRIAGTIRGESPLDPTFHIQTAITQRLLDFSI